MSLGMFALRVVVVQALRAAGTIVGDRVLDSQIAALDRVEGKLQTNQQKPFIAVYTDTARADVSDAAGLRNNEAVDLILNYGISAAMTVPDPETGESVIEGFPATDATFEALLDVLDRQILFALLDPENPWAALLSRFVKLWRGKVVMRSSAAPDRARIAAGQMKLTLDLFPDPVGAPPEGSPWAALLALARAEGLPEAGILEKALTAPLGAGMPDYERLLSMAPGDAASLLLYEVTGAARSVRFDGAVQFEGGKVTAGNV